MMTRTRYGENAITAATWLTTPLLGESNLQAAIRWAEVLTRFGHSLMDGHVEA